MAKQEHLDILLQGVETWNSWRIQNEQIEIDLSNIDLKGCNFSNINLSDVNLFGAKLEDVNLDNAILENTNLEFSNLTNVDFVNAKLYKPNMTHSVLKKVNFTKAYLDNPFLKGALLEEIILDNTYFECYFAEHCQINSCDFSKNVDFSCFKLNFVTFSNVNLSGADLSNLTLGSFQCSFYHCDLSNANLSAADFTNITIYDSNLSNTILTNCNLSRSNHTNVNFSNSNLENANLSESQFFNSNLTGANLKGADLKKTSIIETIVEGANFDNSSVYGVSVWNLQGHTASENNLVITKSDEPVITVSDLAVAQFIYFMLNNKNIRNVINSITSKGVLILGRFSDQKRKEVLDKLREKLVLFDLLPIVFDFDCPTDKDYTETIQTIAGMSMFVIADVTNPKSTPLELEATVKHFKIPYVPIIDISVDPNPFAMMSDLRKSFHWVLPTIKYDSIEKLIDDSNLKKYILDPVYKKREELRIAKNDEPESILLA